MPRVLHIEDNPGDARLVRALLAEARLSSWGLPRFELEWVDRLQSALTCLDEGGIDVVLTDLDLPDSQAERTFARLRTHAPHVPIVVLTGRTDEELARQTVRAGAQDYLFKTEATGSLLARTMSYAIERQQAKQILHDSQTRYRQLAELSPDAILVHRQGQILFANSASANLLGAADPQALIGESIHAFTHDDYRQLVQERLHQVQEQREPADFVDQKIVRLDGQVIDVEVASVPVTYQDGPAVQVVARDITERKQTEATLNETEEMYRTLAENASVFILVVQDGQVVYRNRAYQEQMGLTLADTADQSFLTFVAPEDKPRVKAYYEKRLRGEAVPERYQADILTPHGRRLTVEVNPRIIPFRGRPATMAVMRDITEQVRSEKILREGQTRYRDLFDRVPVGLYRITPEGKILDANLAMVQMLGYPDRESLLSVNASELYSYPEVRRDWLKQLHREETLHSFEVQLRRYDGSLIWVTESTRVVRDAKGGVRYQEGSLKDVTERVQAERALRESRNLFQSLIQSLPQNVFSKDLEGRLTYANQHYCTLQSKSLEEILGKTDFDIHPPELAKKYRRDDQRVIESGQIFETVEAHQPQGGQKTYVRVIKVPILDAEGQVSGVLGIFWDITEQRRAEEALAHERDLLHALMDNIPDTIYFKDRDSRFTRINQAQAWVLGLPSPQAAIGKTDLDFFPPEQAQVAYAAERKIVETGRPLVDQVEKVRWADGQFRWVSATKVPIVDARGRVTGIVGISRDITDRVQAEQALEEKARELARSNADLEQFAYVISHDLREPLRMVASYLRLLQREYGGQIDAEADEFIQYAVDGATRMQAMVRDLLEYSRVGQNGGGFAPVDCGRVLEHALDNLLLAVRESEAVISYDRLPTVWGDETQLEQLFQNLIANAIKFRSQEPPRVHVSAEREEEGWRFSVRDNGIGIDPVQAERIFEIFQRLHTLREYEGTGIGLAICKKIVERHGGRIWVASQPGQGATFYFTLPKRGREGQKP